MQIDQELFDELPDHLKLLFIKLPNPERDEVVSAFPETTTGNLNRSSITAENKIYGKRPKVLTGLHEGSTGSAARYFYCAKANKKERNGSGHPTIKPIKLMRYLVRLITPPGGMVLDPFAGTGTTGEAALKENFRVAMIERETEYQQDIRNRIATIAEPAPVERKKRETKAAV